ncbi:copper amine oxidase N-terminal domain-containing protein [Acetivibrio cellulolyticus]|uniref:copper amine oxidase N-terminal domain-containing protein n=1 Tax=Acetivibrio cellulolyticus TaxID=35830 RepID=UPI0001E2DE82|nr:copper amine oxidase N-terminal domain-containing protein [Acetivibrio cellulolyticus]
MKIKRVFSVLVTGVLVAVLLFGMTTVTFAEGAGTTVVLQVNSTTATINGKSTTLDVPPYVDPSSNRTLVPLRFISESLGYIVIWNGQNKSIEILNKVKMDSYDYSYKDEDTGETVENYRSLNTYKYAKLSLGSNIATVCNNYVYGEYSELSNMTIEQAPVIKNSRTMLPIRFVAEQMNLNVIWDSKTKKITLSPKGEGYTPQAIETALEKFVKPAGKEAVNVENDPAYVKSEKPQNYFIKVSKDIVNIDVVVKSSGSGEVVLSGRVVGLKNDKAYLGYKLTGQEDAEHDGYLQVVDNSLVLYYTDLKGEKCSVTFPNP